MNDYYQDGGGLVEKLFPIRIPGLHVTLKADAGSTRRTVDQSLNSIAYTVRDMEGMLFYCAR